MCLRGGVVRFYLARSGGGMKRARLSGSLVRRLLLFVLFLMLLVGWFGPGTRMARSGLGGLRRKSLEVLRISVLLEKASPGRHTVALFYPLLSPPMVMIHVNFTFEQCFIFLFS